MLMGISYQTMIAYLFIFILAVLFLVVLASPVRLLLKIVLNSFIGAVGIIIFNFIGKFFDFTIGLNPGSLLTVGILGIPGFLLLVFFKLYLF